MGHTENKMLRDEISYLKEQNAKLKAKCDDRIEVQMQIGSRIGKLEHQRNEARRKHGVLKKKVRQIVFVQKAAVSENARLVCESVLLEKELSEARDRISAFEQAQAKRIDRAVEAQKKLTEEYAAEKTKVPA